VRGTAKALLCAGLIAAAAAGCAPESSIFVKAHKPIELAVFEYHLRPDTVTTSAGTQTFVVRNDGILVHNFVILKGKKVVNLHPPAIFPGQSTTVSLPLRPGTYTLESNIQSDQEFGARAKLIVRR
jgi:iron uptake system EfeUOB component EfeO/EfeM